MMLCLNESQWFILHLLGGTIFEMLNNRQNQWWQYDSTLLISWWAIHETRHEARHEQDKSWGSGSMCTEKYKKTTQLMQ